MSFRNKCELKTWLNEMIKLGYLKKIGYGVTGVCYHDLRNNKVYKIFHFILEDCSRYEEDDLKLQDKEQFLKFSKIKNKTFYFTEDVIWVDDEIVGQILPYRNAKNLYKISPLKIKLSKFEQSIKSAYEDIKLISRFGVLTYDLEYNILYGNRFYVTDHNEFCYSSKKISTIERQNINNFNYELYYFLVDGYFNEFVRDYYKLNKMYSSFDPNILEFIFIYKKMLSEYVGFEIETLGDAKGCRNKTKLKEYKYERDLPNIVKLY